MSEQLYRIKPLEWHDMSGCWIATCDGFPSGYMAFKIGKSFAWRKTDSWQENSATSIEHAKICAEAHWRGRLLNALEPIAPSPAGGEKP